MFLDILRSRWFKFLLLFIITWSLIGSIMNGTITVFWFLLDTLFIAYLLASEPLLGKDDDDDDDNMRPA